MQIGVEEVNLQPKRGCGSCFCGSCNKQWSCGCCCCCCCGWGVAIFVLAFVVAFLVSLAKAGDVTAFTNVDIEAADGTVVHAYFAKAECTASDPCPVSIMFHDKAGLRQDIIDLADLFVSQRRVAVLVPDLLRGVTSQRENYIYNYIFLRPKQERVDSDVAAALVWLGAQPEVDLSRVISGPGFSWGGQQAVRFTTHHEVAGTIMLYKSWILEGMASASNEKWGLLGAGDELLCIFGDKETGLEHLAAFEERLEERKVDAQILAYPDVGRGFVSKHAIDGPDVDGGVAKVAWNDILAFFDNLKHRRRLQNFMSAPALASHPT